MKPRARRDAEQRPLPPDFIEALAELALDLADNNEKEDQKNDEARQDPVR